VSEALVIGYLLDSDWHRTVRGLAADFAASMEPFGPVPVPLRMVPWPRPLWMCHYAERTILYPDYDTYPVETIQLNGEIDANRVANARKVVTNQQCHATSVAHEMFHLWRHDAGRETGDYWYEEFVVGLLTGAWTRQFRPDLVEFAKNTAPDEPMPQRCSAIINRLVSGAPPVPDAPRPDTQCLAHAGDFGSIIGDVELIQRGISIALAGKRIPLDRLVADLIRPISK